MYYVRKQLKVSAAHNLSLDYESPCTRLHGHNWIITVHCKNQTLNANGMVEDFALISRVVKEKMDHQYLNEVFPFNPTAENIAKWICDTIPTAYRVEVEESANNIAIYEADAEN